MRYVDVGNTEIAAAKLQAAIGADMFRIEMKEPYSLEYKKCVAEAVKDKKKTPVRSWQDFPRALKNMT